MERAYLVVLAAAAIIAVSLGLVAYRAQVGRPSGRGQAVNASAPSSGAGGGVNVTVRIVAVPGGAGVALVNGSRVELPAVLSVARCSVLNVSQASKPGWEALNGTLTVRACRDTEVRLAWRRIYATVKFEGEGPFQLDGKNMSAPVTVKLPLYTLHNVTQLPYKRAAGYYVPLNRTLTLNVTGNLTVRLAWRMECGGVLVRSDGPAVEVVSGGARYRTPVCLPSPATLEAPPEVPINATHSWWLAWYWVGFRGGGGHWWSPTLNGSKLEVSGRPVVTLHYYVGLRGLRYVQAVVKWPPPFFNGSCPLNPGKPIEDIEVKNGWVHVYNPRTCAWKDENVRVGVMFVTLKLPREVGTVVFEVWVPEWNGKNYYDGAQIEYFFVKGGTRLGHEGQTYYRVYYPQLNHDAGRPYTPVVIAMNGYSTSIISGRDGWVKSDITGGPGPYGFEHQYPHGYWELPPGGKYLYVDLGSWYKIDHEFYVRIIGVTP